MVAVALLFTSGCGGGRPSEAGLAKTFKEGGDGVAGVGKLGDKSADSSNE